MAKGIDWERQIGRRLKLRDLHVLSTVASSGSMAKAARQLGISQPAVSEVVADLEKALGVRLFDRHAWGVAPTLYGEAILRRSTAAFDELKQGIRDVEFLADPARGEIRVGCVESLAVTVLPEIALRFAKQHPGVVVNVDTLTAPAVDLPGVRERKYDCIMVRLVAPLPDYPLPEDLHAELLFNDSLVIAAGVASPFARRRKIDLADLAGEPWILPPPGTLHHTCLVDAFAAKGLAIPTASLISLSLTLRAQLMANGPYLSIFGDSVMKVHARRHGIAVLPITLPIKEWPAVLVTLKNRTLSPVVERFIVCAREVAASFNFSARARRRYLGGGTR